MIADMKTQETSVSFLQMPRIGGKISGCARGASTNPALILKVDSDDMNLVVLGYEALRH